MTSPDEPRVDSPFRSPSFVFGASVLVGWAVIALFAPGLAPYDPVETVGGARKPPSAEVWFGILPVTTGCGHLRCRSSCGRGDHPFSPGRALFAMNLRSGAKNRLAFPV